jgi:elongation factor P
MLNALETHKRPVSGPAQVKKGRLIVESSKTGEETLMHTASDLKKNLRIKIDNEPYIVMEFNFVKPGKGQALYRCKLKNMITGSQFERTFRSVDNFESADLQEKKMQYLYQEEGKYCFMDNISFEQVFLTGDQVGDAKNFMIDNIEASILFFEDRPLGISLPNFVDLVVTEAEPWAKGDSVTGNTKPVVLQTGYKILVPTFIDEGEKIRVDTRSGEYLTRVKE